MAQVARNQGATFADDEMGVSTVPGYEFNDRTYKETPLLEDVKRSDTLKLTSAGWRKTTPGERANGMAAKWGKAGTVGFDILVVGEMDGFVNLTPGASLYPSTTTNGGLQTDVVASFVPQVLVVRPGRVRFDFMT